MNLNHFLALSKEERASFDALYLVGKMMGDADAEALALVLPQCTSLQYLYLDENNIGDVGAKALAKVLALAIPKSLEAVNLWFNHIGDAGILAFARTWPTYKIYILNGNDISRAAHHVLGQAQKQAPFRWAVFEFISNGLFTKTSPAFTFLMRDGDGAVMNIVLNMLV